MAIIKKLMITESYRRCYLVICLVPAVNTEVEVVRNDVQLKIFNDPID